MRFGPSLVVSTGTSRWLLLAGLGALARCADVDLATGPSATLVPWSRGADSLHELGPETLHPARESSCGPCARPCGASDVCAAERCVPQWASAPRLLLPASLGRVTTQRPTLRWLLPDGAEGARLELCRERACDVVVSRFDDLGESHRLPTPLPRGVYFWRVFPRFNGEYSDKASATWEFVVRPIDAPIDTSFGRLNDLNGDGFADALVGASETRAVGVFLGSPTGISPQAELTLPAAWEGLPARVSSVGDLNGDGFGDLIARLARGDGSARLLFIPGRTRPSAEFAVELRSDAPWARSMVGAGDLDGDGFGDLLGADPEEGGRPARLWIWYGTRSGVFATPRPIIEASAGSGLGRSLAALGDLNGDGRPDLVLGAPAQAEGAGRAIAWINGGCSAGQLVELGTLRDVGARLGDAVGLASDTDGDGFVEALAAAPYSPRDTGRAEVQVFPGDAEAMPQRAAATVSLPGAQQEGVRLAPGGDLNGDGYSDLVVWVHSEQRGPSFSLYYGGPSGLARAPARVVYPQDFGATETALSVSLLGDTDRDGFDDLLVRLAPGQALVAPGSAGGPRVGPTPFLTLP